MILRSPLPRIHYYQNKWLQVKESQYLIPTYSWTLTLIPNWTCFIMTISHFQCTDPSTWLTINLRRMLVVKFFSSSTRWRSWFSLVTKPYGIQTPQLLEEKEELGQTRFPITLFFTLMQLRSYATSVTFYGPQNNSYICLGFLMFRAMRKESSNIYPQIRLKSTLKNWIS